MRRGLVTGYVAALALAGAAGALANNLNGVTAQRLTVFSAASTVPTSSCSSSVTADTYIDSAHAKLNYGTATSMQVVSSSKNPSYSLVQFSPCASANAKILSATMQLYLRTAPSPAQTYGAYLITSSWSETSVTWNTSPTISGSASATASTGVGWMSWSLAADVQSMVNGGGNNGWAIEDANTSSTTGTFDTKETSGGNPGTLSITYYP